MKFELNESFGPVTFLPVEPMPPTSREKNPVSCIGCEVEKRITPRLLEHAHEKHKTKSVFLSLEEAANLKEGDLVEAVPQFLSKWKRARVTAKPLNFTSWVSVEVRFEDNGHIARVNVLRSVIQSTCRKAADQ